MSKQKYMKFECFGYIVFKNYNMGLYLLLNEVIVV